MKLKMARAIAHSSLSFLNICHPSTRLISSCENILCFEKYYNRIRSFLRFLTEAQKLLPFAFLLLELGVLAMRRPISGLEYNNLRKESRGTILRGRRAPLQPPALLSFSLNMIGYIEGYNALLQDHIFNC